MTDMPDPGQPQDAAVRWRARTKSWTARFTFTRARTRPTERTVLTEQNVATADELRARVRAAEQEEQAAIQRYEAFGVLDPTSEGSPEYEEAYRNAGRAWVKAEMARHELDASLHPRRYARRGYQGEPELEADA